MATNYKPQARRPAPKPIPSTPPAPVEVPAAVEEPAAVEQPAEVFVESAAEAAPASAPALAVIVAAASASSDSAEPETFDPMALPLKTLDLWNDNATAIMGFAKELREVKSFGEAVELQTRFAAERGEAFLRQSKELAELAGKLSGVKASPLGFSLVC